MVRVLFRYSVLAFAALPLAVAAQSGGGEPAARAELSALLDSADDKGFERAFDVREFRFPDDHGPHPTFRNEWWYFTGNLDSESGRRFGYELTVFRFKLRSDVPPDDSAWRSNQVYIAHFALTDADRDEFHAAERYSRGAAGLAGATSAPFRVWIDDWDMRETGDGKRWRLRAADRDFAIDLELDPLKAPVLQGVDGLSQKSAEPGNASYYYSMTRWQTDGRVTTGGEEFTVSGLSWLDREWSSSALGADQQGWDWFALQLDDGSDLMFYNLRLRDGSRDEHSAGKFVAPNGGSRYLASTDVDIRVLSTWSSPAGGVYPSEWELTVPAEGLRVRITPVIPDQELETLVRYWEGAVDVDGELAGVAIEGRGYVELTGYADEP